MEIYLVGGAVRDQLLGLDVHERDWVVVGGNSEQLIQDGYEQVGKDFPVFLHPDSKEEYALARIERKSGVGHTGFECDASETVTLEEDLLRRDLTINAMAKSPAGELIDHYGGLNDLKLGLLRHVSDAFAEDPLRILRVARFYAKLSDFIVHPETLSLLKEMVEDSQLQELPPERIWTETVKALYTDHPNRFFELIEEIDAHRRLWPSISVLSTRLLQQIQSIISDPELRFAALCFNAGDGLKNDLVRLRVPNIYSDLALATTAHLDQLMTQNQSSQMIIDTLYATDAFRRTERFSRLIQLAECIADVLGKPKITSWSQFAKVASEIDGQQVNQELKGPAFGAALKQLRIDAVQDYLASRAIAR